MCLIIIKPKNIEFPNKELLYQAFKQNPDGAGIAYNQNGKVYISKGYMSYNHFINYYEDIIQKISKKSTLIIHFRKASRGRVNAELTHPFPISNDIEILKQLFIKTEYAVVHNGTIKQIDKYWKKERKLSDTIIFIQKYLSLIAQNENWFNKEYNKELLELLLNGDRMCILNFDGELMIIGQFFKYDNLLLSKELI